MPRNNDVPAGCALGFFGLWLIAGLAWFGFIIWCLYSVVTWLTAQ